MKQLPKKYHAIEKRGATVAKWVQGMDSDVERQVSAIQTNDGLIFLGIISGMCSFFGLIFCVMVYALPPHGEPRVWPMLGIVFASFFFGGIALSVGMSARNSKKQARLQAAKRAELQADLESDPLYLRGKLILRAMQDYAIHRDKYRAWVQAVNEELTDPDEDGGTRYLSFIVKAHGVLMQAIDNFQNATELVKRQKIHRRLYPELAAASNSTALSELIAQLDEPVELPPNLALANPLDALEFEEALESLASGADEKVLTARIEAAAAKTLALPAKGSEQDS